MLPNVCPAPPTAVSHFHFHRIAEHTSPAIVAAAKPSDMATPQPDEDPEGSWFAKNAPVHWPCSGDHPFGALGDRLYPNSLMVVLPRMMAPSLRSFWTTVDSKRGRAPTRAYEPPVGISIDMQRLLIAGQTCGIQCIQRHEGVF